MIVDMTEQGFRISAEKAAAKMPNCHVDEYMLHWITHISVDAYPHLLTHERDVEKAKLHMRRVMAVSYTHLLLSSVGRAFGC